MAGDAKWAGIAAAGDRLFCAPSNASSVLVIDAATEAADQSRTLTKAEQRKAGRTRIFYAEATVALPEERAARSVAMAIFPPSYW